MPNFHYTFHNPGACAGTPAAALTNPAHPRVDITYAQLMNAQLRLGVYPGGGWDIDEITWRIYSFIIGFTTIVAAAAAGAAIPAAPPVAGIGQVPFVTTAAGANLPVSPVALGVDSTEKGQIGYHLGTAVGGYLASCMDPGNANAIWFALHLSRAEANGGVFTFATPQRPDIVAFSLDVINNNWYEFVVWENKGHCINNGAIGAINPALTQAQSLINCTNFPGGMPLAFAGGPWAVDAHVASMVDLFHGNFRVQVIDPPGPGSSIQKGNSKSTSDFLRCFYNPFREIIRFKKVTKTYDGKKFYTVKLVKDVTLGLDAAIVDNFNNKNFSENVARALSKGYANKNPDLVYVDPTGISVELPRNWAPNS